MASSEVDSNMSVVARLANLPLVSSTCGLLAFAYCNTKDHHPYLRSVCEVAETGVKTLSSVALTRASPVIDKLKPQIAVANDLACKGLDKIEQTWPFLHQPPDKVFASAMDVVMEAKEAVAITTNGAREVLSYVLAGVIDRTRGAVLEKVEVTRAAVSGSVHSMMGSRVARLVSTGVDSALSTSETLVDQYLPLTDDELEKKAKVVEGFEVASKPSCYVRLGSLSTKLRKRAYQQALAKVQDGRARSQDYISQLHHTVDLIEYARRNVGDANDKLHGVQGRLSSWVEWKRGGHDGVDGDEQHMESRILAMARSLTHQIQTTCLALVPSLQGLPQNIQHQALLVALSASQIYTNFSGASTFRDLSDGALASSRGQLARMKESLDGLMDYLVNNTPLNWLVPDFTITDLAPEPDEVLHVEAYQWSYSFPSFRVPL